MEKPYNYFVSYAWTAYGKSGNGCSNIASTEPIKNYDEIKLVMDEIKRTTFVEGKNPETLVLMNIQRFPI